LKSLAGSGQYSTTPDGTGAGEGDGEGDGDGLAPLMTAVHVLPSVQLEDELQVLFK